MTARTVQGVVPDGKKTVMAKHERREWRHKMQILKKKEYHRLRNMVPCIAAKPNVSKVTVVEEAVKYIDQLHAALFSKMKARSAKTEGSFQLDNIRFGEKYPQTCTTHDMLRNLMMTTSAFYHQQTKDASSTTKNDSAIYDNQTKKLSL